MQHCPARAARQLAAAALALVLLLALAAPRAHAALQEKHGIRLLTFDHSQILSIGNQTSGKCSWYALRYARTILDGRVCSGSGMWSNGVIDIQKQHIAIRDCTLYSILICLGSISIYIPIIFYNFTT